MCLTVEEYNKYEMEGKKKLSNRFLEAFQPEVFEKTGFPTRIVDNKEICKFLDSQHDGRLESYYKDKNTNWAPTYEEFEMIKALAKDIYSFSKTLCGKGIVVKASMLASAHVCRRIKDLQRGGMPTVFEIGGGNGVLGAMLHRLGYRYMSTDITQAFYLTQNNLWNGIHSECVLECIESVDILNNVDKNKILHIPYWKLWELRNSDLEADIVVSNANVLEMSERALLFYLQYVKQLLRNSDYKLFIIQDPGSAMLRTVNYLITTFDKMGYCLLYSERYFAVFALKDKKQIIPAHIGDIMARESYKAAFPVYGNTLDKTAAAIYEANRKIRDEEKVALAEIEKFFYSLDENIDSPDEEFIHYCGYKEL